MLEHFKADFWLLSRENRGFYSWAEKSRWSLYRAMRRRLGHCRMCDDGSYEARDLVQSLFDDGLGLHPLLDVVFESFARAEARFSLRFIPQRSNEERLTGHLISEIEAAIYLAKSNFATRSKERYGVEHQFDFAYTDLSQGGQREKFTGGDFGLIISVDLPDRPKQVRYAAVQGKKLDASTTVDKAQFETLVRNYGSAACYLFYDMKSESLAPPLVISAADLQSKIEKNEPAKSFSMQSDAVSSSGLPFSLWVVSQLAQGKVGQQAADFSGALTALTKFNFDEVNSNSPNGGVSRLAMVSIGKPFKLERDLERGIVVSLD